MSTSDGRGMRDGGRTSIYRPEIDGLRAVAVVPVVFFHAGSGVFAGGYVGVDVFFVISGFLITTLIREEMREGSFSLVRFYERRVRRIAPALLFVSFACLPFAWAWMLPAELDGFAQSLAAVNLLGSNILFWREEGYFALVSELKPLLHTWSLSVEEQFYLFFPLLLLALRGIGTGGLFVVLGLVVLASLGLAHWGARAAPSATFYLLPTRAWELGVGALLALSAPLWRDIRGWPAQIGAAAGLGAIGAAVLLFDTATPFPSLWALLPVLGAAAVIVFAQPGTLAGRLLAWRPVVVVGLVSYSLYLWHQPIFAFARIRVFGEPLSTAVKLGLIALAFVLALATWRLVEQPFRRRSTLSRRQIFVAAGGTAAALLAVGVFLDATEGVPTRVSPQALAAASWGEHYSPHREACHSDPVEPIAPAAACVLGAAAATDAVPLTVWGDSHGVELAWRLAQELGPLLPVRQLTHTDCAPILSDAFADASCTAFNKAALDLLVGEPADAPVILFARWSIQFEAERFDNGEGGVERGERRPVLDDDPAVIGDQLAETVARLSAAGRRIVLVYPVPEVGWNVPEYLSRSLQYHARRTGPLSTSYDVYRRRNGRVIEQLDRLGERPNLVRVRPDALLCNSVLPGRCVAELDGAPLYYDDDHLNALGAGLLAGEIIEAMEREAWLAPEAERSASRRGSGGGR